ncbi:MAG: hypothetical protein FJW30_02885 [Acidobacteria bacterium]|nr:hypothetical protein [Acidobacteriota bacterium]
MRTLLLASMIAAAGEFPRTLEAFRGATPKLDGEISKNEWTDANSIEGTKGTWISTFSPVTDAKDLAVKGYVKHDGKRLYFAFDVTDDVLYGIDIPRWIPKENPKVHELTRDGFPWFGDEMEILIDANNKWKADESVAGNGQSWQMVCNLTKSRLGGVGKGGILEGEPRRELSAWNTYQKWINERSMECAAKVKPGGKGYILEWAINFNPCLEVEPGVFYSPSMGDRKMGLNIALGDIDQPERGEGNYANFHHEDWFAGTPKGRTRLREFGTLWIRTAILNKKNAPR